MSTFNWDKIEESQVATTFDMGGGTIEPIPDNTTCIAIIEEVKWSHFEMDDYINIKWRVARPEEYSNRVVFQKVKINGTEACKDREATIEKATRMLMAIDANAGGKLRAKKSDLNDNDLMSCLMGKQMAIKVMKWDFNDKTGNWVAAVSPAKAEPVKQEAPANNFDDDIPF